MSVRGLQGGHASRLRGCYALGALLLLALAGGCTTLTGGQVPPPWDGRETPARPTPTARRLPPPSSNSTRVATSSPDRPAIYSTDAMASSPEAAAPAGDAGVPPPRPPAAGPSRAPAPSLLRLAENVPAFGAPKTVATVPAPAGPAGYVVGVGDTLVITVYGQPDLSGTVNVSDDGTVPLALIGRTRVAGLTPAQAAERIAAELRNGQYLVDPQVSVTLSQYLSQQISVLGDVKNPGRFPVSVRLTVLDALALAGGVTDMGSQRIYVLRPDTSASGGIVTRYEIDIDALLAAGAGQEYFDVRAGDTLMVPRAEMFYIYGEVRAPNAYKLRPDMTVMQALSLGGGLTDKGSNSRLQIRRRGPDGRLVTESASLTDRVQANDVIFVRERIF